jgi:hypothetical protein
MQCSVLGECHKVSTTTTNAISIGNEKISLLDFGASLHLQIESMQTVGQKGFLLDES